MHKLAIVGASGLVGKTILEVLNEENLLNKFQLFLLTSEKNEGKSVDVFGKSYKYMSLNKKCLNMKFDFVILAAGENISKLWAENFAKQGAFVIDNSNAFRREKNIPLVVPEINSHLINKNTKIIANPNCSTIQLAVVIAQILKVNNIEKIIVSTYQSVSGAGKEALEDLKNNTKKIFKNGIKNNIIAQIGETEENGFCKEENKIMFELNKILDMNINISATSVRVPIEVCHGESVYIECSEKVDLIKIKNILKCKYISISDDIWQINDVKNKNNTFICRLRQNKNNDISFFVLADNLRRGAAYNAVLILEKILANEK